MRLTSRVATFSTLLLIVITASLSMTAPSAFAKQIAVHTSNQLPPPVATISIQPDFLPVALSFDSNGNISFGLSQSYVIESLGFVVIASVSQSFPLLSTQAQQTTMSGVDLLLIIRHKQGGSLVDSNYLLKAKQTIQSVDVKGDIREVSVRWTGKNYMVFIDASQGNISSIMLQGVSAGTTEPVKMGCPGPSMVAWSMNVSLGSIKEVSGSPCTYDWTNPNSGGADGQCPTGYGSANIQLNFPWWHIWDQGETHTCDGKSATTLDDMGVADSATITFRFSAMPNNPSPTIQYCRIVLSVGLNVRTASNTQAAIVAHYDVGTTLNFVKVVTGENVDGNSLWGESAQGHFYWLGGTDHPNG